MNIVNSVVSSILVFITMFSLPTYNYNESKGTEKGIDTGSIELKHNVKSAYLIEAQTGEVLFSKDEEESNAIASVTKVMTLLLVMEALNEGCFKLDDTVIISKNAASMGGSQVFLEEGESISVEELIKCAVIASANDASVALAELVSGSESAFVRKMNDKAEQLGLVNTYFENTTGLDDTTVNHHSCSKDIATISRELIKYNIITKYSSIWQDSIRNGEMVLTNTNRLIRYYEGCNGLKTGSTDKAGFCITVTAKRGNMQLIAVVLGAKTKDERNATAVELMDYGFANFALYESGGVYVESSPVYGGTQDNAAMYSTEFKKLVQKPMLSKIEVTYEIPEYLIAPLVANDTVGKIIYSINGEVIGESNIYVKDDVAKITLFQVITRILSKIIVGK